MQRRKDTLNSHSRRPSIVRGNVLTKYIAHKNVNTVMQLHISCAQFATTEKLNKRYRRKE